MLKTLDELLHNAVSTEVKSVIHKTFEKYKDPFSSFDQPEKRLKMYKNLGLYIKPETISIEGIHVPKINDKELVIQSKRVRHVF